MIILDTNVVAEVMKPSPIAAVLTWLNAQEASTLFLTAITLGEIRYGLCAMPRGVRRQRLEEGFDRVIAAAFAGRILAFGEHAAVHYGEVMARRKELGRPLSVLIVARSRVEDRRHRWRHQTAGEGLQKARCACVGSNLSPQPVQVCEPGGRSILRC